MIDKQNDNKQDYCLIGFQKNTENNGKIVLGQVALANYLVSYDLDSNSMVFAGQFINNMVVPTPPKPDPADGGSSSGDDSDSDNTGGNDTGNGSTSGFPLWLIILIICLGLLLIILVTVIICIR